MSGQDANARLSALLDEIGNASDRELQLTIATGILTVGFQLDCITKLLFELIEIEKEKKA